MQDARCRMMALRADGAALRAADPRSKMMALRADGAALRAADPRSKMQDDGASRRWGSTTCCRSKMQDIPYLASHILHRQRFALPHLASAARSAAISCILDRQRKALPHPASLRSTPLHNFPDRIQRTDSDFAMR